MTGKELNSVREIKEKIREAENRLSTLKISVANLVPIIDGLPHATQAKSRVEKFALMIVEAERELESLRGQLLTAKTDLADQIMSEVDAPTEQTLLVLRYVECLSFKETARRMNFSLRYVYKLHDSISNWTPTGSHRNARAHCGKKQVLI